MKTMQEIFDEVCNHLITQNQRALNETANCVYRAENGLKCAAGCLIKDEHYSPALEMLGADEGVVTQALEKSGVPAEYNELVFDLQSVHDNTPVSFWKKSLRQVAGVYELQEPPCLNE
jgi:hypothetical protein